MSDNKELIWIDKELLPKWDLLQDILRLRGGDLDKVLDGLKRDDDTMLECLDENFIEIKHHAKKVRDEYEKVVNEQIEKTEKLWSDCDARIKESRTKLEPIKNMFNNISDDMDRLNRKFNDLPVYKLNECINILERFTSMTDDNKKKVKMLFDMEDK